MAGPKGPMETRLDAWLDGTTETELASASGIWDGASINLSNVALSLERASEKAATLGGETGPRAAEAFKASATSMRRKSRQLAAGSTALFTSAQAVQNVREERARMGEPAPRPTPSVSDGVANPTPAQITQRGQDQVAIANWGLAQQQREREAERLSHTMNTSLQKSAEEMKKIHGEPDPTPKGPSHGNAGGGGGGGTSSAGAPPGPGGGSSGPGPGGVPGGVPGSDPGAGGHPASSGPDTPGSPGSGGTVAGTTPDWLPAGTGQGGTGLTPGGTITGSTSSSGGSVSTPGGPGGAVTGAVTGGALGGAMLGGMGAMSGAGGGRGSITPVSTASAATGRTIGSSSRTGAASTLGRSTAVPATASSSTARGTGTGAGTRGGRSGGGAAGGRTTGSGAGAGGRGQGRKKERRNPGDHYDNDDWDDVDDEAAPPVLG